MPAALCWPGRAKIGFKEDFMRCPKCGYISFDYVSNCEKCGRDLGDTAGMLGSFIMVNSDLDWFQKPDSGGAAEDAAAATAVQSEIEAPAVDLAAIDVSDLVQDEMADMDEITVLDSSILETVAEDENFQKALDDVINE